MMENIHKSTALKEVRDNGAAKFYIAPSNVNSANIDRGWNLGHEIEIVVDRTNNQYLVVKYKEEEQELETYLNNFKYYNCNNELGKRVRFWKKI